MTDESWRPEGVPEFTAADVAELEEALKTPQVWGRLYDWTWAMWTEDTPADSIGEPAWIHLPADSSALADGTILSHTPLFHSIIHRAGRCLLGTIYRVATYYNAYEGFPEVLYEDLPESLVLERIGL